LLLAPAFRAVGRREYLVWPIVPQPDSTMSKTLTSLLLLACVSALRPAAAPAQTPEQPAPADTAAAVDSLAISPRSAFLRSLAVPGWGQAYVGSPVRGGLYFALEATSLWMLYRSRAELAQARAKEAFFRETGELGASDPLPLADSRRKQVEDWVTLSIFFVLFSGADAYVSAQLSDFSEHVGVLPDETGALRIEARFPTRLP
jgi:hypothetical protein